MEHIIGEDFELTDAIKSAVEEKKQQINKFTKDDPPIKVFLSKNSKNEFDVKMTLHSLDQDFAAHATGDDFYLSLNEAKAKIIRQITDFNEKILTKRHQ